MSHGWLARRQPRTPFPSPLHIRAGRLWPFQYIFYITNTIFEVAIFFCLLLISKIDIKKVRNAVLGLIVLRHPKNVKINKNMIFDCSGSSKLWQICVLCCIQTFHEVSRLN